MQIEDDEWLQLIDGVRNGNEEACQKFWNLYGGQIQRLAERNLDDGLQRRVGPESIMQSACRTFFRRAQKGEFGLPDAESLWRLLCAITLNKIRQQARFHLRQKRSVDQEVNLDARNAAGERAHAELTGDEATPAQLAEFDDQLQHLLSSLDEKERQVVDFKLQEFTNQEIASRLKCSERTVRRLMKRIQSQLTELLEVNN